MLKIIFFKLSSNLYKTGYIKHNFTPLLEERILSVQNDNYSRIRELQVDDIVNQAKIH